jgi:hypothetical protein
MDGREIAERFIRAAEVTEASGAVGPRRVRAAWVDYAHSHADKNGWGTERLAEERREFWNALNRIPSAREISEAEETHAWLAFVADERERLCLLAWARCMATKAIFKDWCAGAGIHPETGRRRKERAILRIMLGLDAKMAPAEDIDVAQLLPDAPENGALPADDVDGVTAWMADGNRPLAGDFDTALDNFDWARKQNERRRAREKRRRGRAG